MWTLVIVIVLLFILFGDSIEGYGGTGALIQLTAKGPQDSHLTGTDTDKYWAYPWSPYYYGWGWRPQFLWNNSTRFRNYPLYGGLWPQFYHPYYY